VAYVKVEDRRSQVIAAARAALARDGVGRTSLRSVAAEAQIPLGNLQYAFASKEALLRAVIEDLISDFIRVLAKKKPRSSGLADTLRTGLPFVWSRAMRSGAGEQLLQYELTSYALRTEGMAELAQWQYQQYCGVLAEWCRKAAADAGERCAVDFDTLARILLAAVDGLVLQYLAEPDDRRAANDLDTVITSAIALADPQPETSDE
jgi:AcrR family transcriptional regulator